MPERRRIKNSKSVKQQKTRASKKTAKKSRVAKKAVNSEKALSKDTSKSEDALKDGLLAVMDLKGKTLETIAVDPLFEAKVANPDIMYQSVLMYQAGEREGTASTKDRGHVRGGGKKPWKQKGTGQARHGSRRSPIWRGGGVTFGPMPRDYSYSIPRQIRRQAVVEGIKDKFLNRRVVMVPTLELAAPKTREVAAIMETFKLEKPLFLVEQKNPNFVLASRNIRGVSIKTAGEVNALDIISHKECVMTRGAYGELLKRFAS